MPPYGFRSPSGDAPRCRATGVPIAGAVSCHPDKGRAAGVATVARFAGRQRGSIFLPMTHTTTVSLPPADVLQRVKRFFAERVPQAAAHLEKEGPQFVVLRGQGGEEVVVHAWAASPAVTRVRASTLFFDQALDRFFSTLPLEGAVEVT